MPRNAVLPARARARRIGADNRASLTPSRRASRLSLPHADQHSASQRSASRHAAKGLARSGARLSPAASAVDVVPGVLLRVAVLSLLPNPVGVAAPGAHRRNDDRHALLGRYILFTEVSLGAGRDRKST